MNRYRGQFSVITALFLFFFPVYSFADTITFSAKTMSGYTGKKKEYTLLEGGAEIKTSKIEIYADKVELSGDDFRYVTASGSVKGKNIEDDMEFSCDILRYDREQELVTLQNNALITDNPNGVTAKAQMIQYNQRTGIALMQITVELRQKDSVCTAAFAIYRKNEQILEMSGDPKIEKGSDVFRAREVVLNLDTEEIRLDGRVRGSVTDTREESGARQTTQENPAEENAE
ncbi:MAG: LptA/OstA family protein [Treponemataceae bacterium]|nr:MAG: LptA/OstA family protein [Treponemataceae bacterium]